MAEVWDLLPVDPGASQVDQVEIHPVDFCSPEINTEEGCLPDFLGALEVLFVEVIGIEAGATPLARDRATDQPAPGRAGVEGRLAQVGAPEVRPFPIDLRQAGRTQAGAAEVGARHPRTG